MVRKVYSTNAVEWTTYVKVGNKLRKITFAGGSFSGSTIRARFTTTEKELQDAIENDPRFGTLIFLSGEHRVEEQKVIISKAKVAPVIEKPKPLVIVEDEPGFKAYDVTKLQEAKEILNKEYGVDLSKIRNKSEIQKAAKENKVSFPNL